MIKRVLKPVLLILGGFVAFYLILFFVRGFRLTEESTEIKTSHFRIIYKGIIKKEADGIADALEHNYARIRTELKDPGHDIITVFIHPDQEDFNKATGLRNSTANGTSRGPLTFHLKYETWFNSIFPPDMKKVAVHEFTHCVQLNILIKDALARVPESKAGDFDKDFELKFSSDYPQWFWEALSDYEAGIVNKLSVKYAMRGKLTLKDLNNSNQIYNVGYTIIEYFVSKWGKKKLPEFIRSYGDFDKVLGVSEEEFQKGWHQFVKENY